jgi:hypothetical protein
MKMKMDEIEEKKSKTKSKIKKRIIIDFFFSLFFIKIIPFLLFS